MSGVLTLDVRRQRTSVSLTVHSIQCSRLDRESSQWKAVANLRYGCTRMLYSEKYLS